jgi:hypothetical protein
MLHEKMKGRGATPKLSHCHIKKKKLQKSVRAANPTSNEGKMPLEKRENRKMHRLGIQKERKEEN